MKHHLVATLFAQCLGFSGVNEYAPRPNCQQFFLDAEVIAPSLTISIPRVDNNIDVVDFALNIDRRTAPNPASLITSSRNVTATSTIYAELCTPEHARHKDVIQILTHDTIFDHRYYQCSYVQAALDAGYTVLNYDRLCNGLSDKPDAYASGHGLTELEILRVLTEIVREGWLNAHLHAGSSLRHTKAFDEVIDVGHSFGSQLATAMLTSYGHLSSGALITGFLFTTVPSTTSAGQLGFEYAASNNPALYGNRGSEYIVSADTSNFQHNFFHQYNDTDLLGFTNEALTYAEGIKSPMTVGEWLSLRGLLNIGPAPAFKGPIQFFSAEFDVLVCGGNCTDNYDLDILEAIYSGSPAPGVQI